MGTEGGYVPLYSLVESTQRVYGVRLFFVSARTNKRHHHHRFFFNFFYLKLKNPSGIMMVVVSARTNKRQE
jgi:hypothetical protein